jgi:hypothetical protein
MAAVVVSLQELGRAPQDNLEENPPALDLRDLLERVM